MLINRLKKSYPIILFLVFFSLPLLAQNKYLIYFKDKGPESAINLNKSSEIYKKTIASLSERAVERRLKTRNINNLIDYDDLPIFSEYLQNIEDFNIKIINKLKWFNAISCKLTNDQIIRLNRLDFIDKIEKVRVFKKKSRKPVFPIASKFNTSQSLLDYGASFTQLNLSDIPSVHELGINGEGVIIGVLDTGFDLDHPTFTNAKIIAEHDFVYGDDDTSNGPEDSPSQQNHGTYVLSVLTGYSEGVLIGVSYNASYVLAKTEDVKSETSVEEDNYAAALEWMESLGVDISTSSLGYNEFDGGIGYTKDEMNGTTTIVARAVEKAFTRGMVTVTSAGNEGNSSWEIITSPADAKNIISVGAVSSSNKIASFSSRGPTSDGRIKPEITTMGVSVLGAAAGSSNFYRASGTSSAAPIAAGITGLLLSRYKYLDNRQIRSIVLESGGNASNPNNVIGYGLLSALRAMTFPNVEFANDGYSIHKIILDSNGVDDSSVQLELWLNGSSYSKENLNSLTKNEFVYKLPNFTINDTLTFAYSYKDSLGITKKIPQNNRYKLLYGNKQIALNTVISVVPEDSIPTFTSDVILLQNFPNPFVLSSGKTTFTVYSKQNYYAEMYIYDLMGQKIKNLLSGKIFANQKNNITWDGKNTDEKLVATGVYFAILKYNNNFLVKKILVIK